MLWLLLACGDAQDGCSPPEGDALEPATWTPTCDDADTGTTTDSVVVYTSEEAFTSDHGCESGVDFTASRLVYVTREGWNHCPGLAWAVQGEDTTTLGYEADGTCGGAAPMPMRCVDWLLLPAAEGAVEATTCTGSCAPCGGLFERPCPP